MSNAVELGSQTDASAPVRDALPARHARRAVWPWLVGVAVFVSAAATAATYRYAVLAPPRSAIGGLRAGGVPVGGLAVEALRQRLKQIGEAALDQRIDLAAGDQTLHVRRRDVGMRVDLDQFTRDVLRVGRSGEPLADWQSRRRAARGEVDVPVPFDLARPQVVEFLLEKKDLLDRAPLDAHLDLERHAIAPERPGVLVDVYASVPALVRAAERGAAAAALVTRTIAPRIRREQLKDIDISTVVGSWETHYSTNSVDSDRTYNLKVGAERLNGHVIEPHTVFSFNAVMGDRTEKEGYRVAPVIEAGELVDGLAGGMCQIASTLHAAAFFAGLDIVSSRPHSRPSVYIPLALDATVVYPSTDLKIRNPFDFPIVLRYQVHQGAVKVELLGKERPHQVIFEREILQETPFGTVHRSDPGAPSGQRLVLQDGYPGYRVLRRRYVLPRDAVLPAKLGQTAASVGTVLLQAGIKPLKEESWTVQYPSTEAIIATGSGPSRLKQKPKPPSHRIPPVPPGDKPIGRIVR